jgi:hypothetical protein
MIQTLGQISDNVGLSELMWHKPLFPVDIQPVSFNIIILHAGDCILVKSPHCPLPSTTSLECMQFQERSKIHKKALQKGIEKYLCSHSHLIF